MSGRSSGSSGSGGQGGAGKPPWIPSGSGGLSHNAFAKASIEARQQQLASARPAVPSPAAAAAAAAPEPLLSPMGAHPPGPAVSAAPGPQLSPMPASAAASAAAPPPRPALTSMQRERAQGNWQRALSAARALTTGGAQQGATGPPGRAPANSVYQRTDQSGAVIQNTIYNQHGLAIAQVDFKQHGKEAPPGHSHRTATPGDIASAHGASGGSTVHYTPESTPSTWKRKQF